MLTMVAGIDEVGFGPILGPLVVASSIFLVKENPEKDMWWRLFESVGRRRKDLGSRILVCDSKKAYSRQTGLKHLEQTVRAFLNQLHPEKENELYFASILPIISNDLTRQIEKYPWYPSLYSDFLPRINPAVSNILTKNMDQEGIEFVDFRCICLDVAEFNQVIETTGNKAQAVTLPILNLIQQIIAIATFCCAKKIVIYCDKLGGRTYYMDMLETNSNIKIIEAEESSRISKYKAIVGKVMRGTGREMDIQFEVGADDKHLPVALASMVGKYIREKVMQHMNEYLIKLQPGLRPTAGYWTDGHRFLRDMVQPETLMRAGVHRDDFVRIK